MTVTHLYLRRIVSIVAVALIALAITQPVSATSSGLDVDPLAGAVAGAVETTTAEVSEAVETAVEPVPQAPAPKEVVKSVTDEVAVPETAGVPSVAVEGGDTSAIAPTTAASDESAQGTGGARGGDGARSGSSKGKLAQGSGSGDDREELLAAGNDVMTTLTLGTVERNAPPKKPRGAPLALTGTSILMGLIAGLVLMAVGVGTETAARRSGPAVA